MDILQRVRADLEGTTCAHQEAIARLIGIPPSTLYKIVKGKTTEPRYPTVEKLRAYYLSPRELSPQQVAWSGRDRRQQMGDD